MFLRREIGAFSVQKLDNCHICSSTSSMRRRSELRTVDVDIRLVPKQCLDDLNAAAEDRDAQRHFPLFMEGVDVCASIEEEFD